jgi:hypothetical protein
LGLMLKEFIDFVDSVLPSVDPEAKDKAKAAIEQFQKNGNRFEYLLPEKLSTLSQGDIVSEVPFSYFKEDGSQYIFRAKGMVISTSCHIDQKEVINIVPVLPLDFFEGDENGKRELEANRIFNYMYFPENMLKDYFVDFSRINTYNKNLIVRGIEEGKIHRICSLSQIGFYLFIIKLTVFFMRKEDAETMESRKQSTVAINLTQNIETFDNTSLYSHR